MSDNRSGRAVWGAVRGAVRLGAGLLFPAHCPVPLGALALSSGPSPPASGPRPNFGAAVAFLRRENFSQKIPQQSSQGPAGPELHPVASLQGGRGLCGGDGSAGRKPLRSPWPRCVSACDSPSAGSILYTHTHLCPFSFFPPLFFFFFLNRQGH